jgi:hypothetical protein
VVSDCFREASSPSGDVSVNNETITEGEPDFSGSHKQSEIKTFKYFPDVENFINTDDDY